MTLPTCWLYVPGDRPERFAKALASGADAVIYDLEDAVAAAAKPAARTAVADQLDAAHEVEQWVRINAGAGGASDLQAIRGRPGLTGVVLPKADLSGVLLVGDIPVVPLVESAAGIRDAMGMAACDHVRALALGEVDLATDLGIDASPDEHALWPLRMHVVAASAAAGRPSPIGPVHMAVRDLDDLRASTERLRRAGFGARQAVHPSHVSVIDHVLAPTTAEVEAAQALLARADHVARGAWVDGDGHMVDEAVLRRARMAVERAQRSR